MANNRVLPNDVADKIRVEFTPGELEQARREAMAEIAAEKAAQARNGLRKENRNCPQLHQPVGFCKAANLGWDSIDLFRHVAC